MFFAQPAYSFGFKALPEPAQPSPDMRQCIVVAIWVQKAAGGLLRFALGLVVAVSQCAITRRGSDWNQCKMRID